MFRLFFIFGFATHVFAALPIVSEVRGYDIYNSPEASVEGALVGNFRLIGDGFKKPFRMRIIFENCAKLKDEHGFRLPLTVIKLKYIKEQPSTWETKELKLIGGSQNCYAEIQFYEDIQDSYYMELWATWNTKGTTGGIFHESANVYILDKP